MNFKEMKEIALANVSQPDSEYFYRKVCRWFSKTFHTPLSEVYKLSFDDILLAYFEEGYEKLSDSEDGEEAIYVDMVKAVDPEYDEKEEEAIEDFIEMVEAEEEAKRKSRGISEPNRQSLQGSSKASQAKPVVKTFDEAAPEEADGKGLDGLDSLSEGLDEGGAGRSRE
jgi:hypothetical protein